MSTKIALSLPGNQNISSPSGFNPEITNLAALISSLFQVAIFIAGVLLLSWFSWGVFQYLFAGGDKEGLARARKRITWAIIGFIIVLASLALRQYLEGIFPQNLPGGVKPITTPTP